MIVGSKMFAEFRNHIGDIERIGQHHLLDIHPVLRAVKKGFEYGEIAACQEWNVSPGERTKNYAPTHCIVVIGGCQEQIYRHSRPPKPHLSVPLKQVAFPSGHCDLGGKLGKHAVELVDGDENIEIYVCRGPGL